MFIGCCIRRSIWSVISDSGDPVPNNEECLQFTFDGENISIPESASELESLEKAGIHIHEMPN